MTNEKRDKPITQAEEERRELYARPEPAPRPRVDFPLPLGWRNEVRRCSVGARCKAEIVWIVTNAGKRMPLDLKSVVRGPAGVDRAESHFAHCPYARHVRRS